MRSIASSRSSSSHSVANGGRYLIFVRRCGPVTRLRLAAPLGHSRPREIGLSGSPSIWMISPSRTNTRWPQPTAQNGHTERTTSVADPVRAVSAVLAAERAAAPRPVRSPPFSCSSSGQRLIRL